MRAWGLFATAIGVIFLALVGAVVLVIAAGERLFAETFDEDF